MKLNRGDISPLLAIVLGGGFAVLATSGLVATDYAQPVSRAEVRVERIAERVAVRAEVRTNVRVERAGRAEVVEVREVPGRTVARVRAPRIYVDGVLVESGDEIRVELKAEADAR